MSSKFEVCTLMPSRKVNHCTIQSNEGEEKLLKEVITHVGKISHGGKGGLQLNFEDYKRIVKIMIMFGEELNWLNGKE